MEEVKKKEIANAGTPGLRRHISGRWISNVPSYEGNEWSSEESEPEDNESNPTSADSVANLKSKEETRHELKDQISEVSEEEEEEEEEDSDDNTSDDDYGFDESSTFVYRKEASGSQETLATKNFTADESARMWAEKRRILLQRLGKNPDTKPADYTATYLSANVKQSSSPLAGNQMFNREEPAGPYTTLNNAASSTSLMHSQKRSQSLDDESEKIIQDTFEGNQTSKLSPSISYEDEGKFASSYFRPPTESDTSEVAQDEDVRHENYLERPVDTANHSKIPSAGSFLENPYTLRNIPQKQPSEQSDYTESKPPVVEEKKEPVSKNLEESEDTPSLVTHQPEGGAHNFIGSESDDSFALPTLKVEEETNSKTSLNEFEPENSAKPLTETSNPIPETFEEKFFQKEDDLHVPLVESPEQSAVALNEPAGSSTYRYVESTSAPTAEGNNSPVQQYEELVSPESPFLYSPHKTEEDRRFQNDVASDSDHESILHDVLPSSADEDIKSTQSRHLGSSDDAVSEVSKDDAVDPPLHHPLYTLVGKTESNSNVFKSNAEKNVSSLKIHENGNLPLTEKKASVINTGSFSETMSISSKASKLPETESYQNGESLENLYSYLSEETDSNVSKLNADDPFWSEGLQDDFQGIKTTESATSLHDPLPTIKEISAENAVPESAHLVVEEPNALSLPKVYEGSRRTSINNEELEAAALTRGSLPSIPTNTNEKTADEPSARIPTLDSRSKKDQIPNAPQLKTFENEEKPGKVSQDKSPLYFASFEAFVKSPLISIKEVNSLGSTDHRCNFFNRKIQDLRNYDSGLDSWIESSQRKNDDISSSKSFSKPLQMDFNKDYSTRSPSPAKSSGSIRHNIAAEARKKSKSAANDILHLFKKKGKNDTDNIPKDSKSKKKLFGKKIGFKP
ncbi:hypothetical protein SPOG_03895 [Schizosaccharomyces cryophilus OY26]|uniref:Uncharacterized protein n=1 Tax=Schizosaccharomyces cryophilus (strain OY26 / ATCC MYA-4695 / CBS 11777 / NBRC 106824 / NRRL Y48691) TaxID=653667 RepID=S9W0L1_SCHCR|nr:uncharacterized protein SPOG_03895 [Schizosaccharomyces cryophilus OY26]EPY53368.1 hypothetical protein SPOG_03895 [Schizosaccharomyces cryophilus OY26]